VDVDAAVADHGGEAREAIEAVGVHAVACGFGEEAGAEGGAVGFGSVGDAEGEYGLVEGGVEFGVGDSHGISLVMSCEL